MGLGLRVGGVGWLATLGGAAIGGSTAVGNQLNVVVQGSHNTVIVNSKQTKTATSPPARL